MSENKDKGQGDDSEAPVLEDSESMSPAARRPSPFSVNDETAGLDESQAMLYTYESIGLFAAMMSLFLLVLNSPMRFLSFGDFAGGIPGVAVYTLSAVLALVLTRVFVSYLSNANGMRIIWFLSLFGSVAAPFGLCFQATALPALIVTAFGNVALMFDCWSHLTLLGHKMLSGLIAAMFTLVALVALLLDMLDIPSIVTVCIAAAFALVSCVFVRLVKDVRVLDLIKLNPQDSMEHMNGPYNINIGRLNYFLTGLSLGIGFMFGNFLNDSGALLFPGGFSSLLVLMPAILAGLLLLVFRYRAEYHFEKAVKNYYSFCMTLALLFLPFAPPAWQTVCVIFLMTVAMAQLVITATAIVEMVRFEEVSPLWYLAEYAYLIGGVTAGIAAVWLCMSGLIGASGLMVCCFTMILIFSFFQVIINLVAYPEASDYSESEKDTHQGIGNAEEETQGKRGSYWRRKLAYLEAEYDLSPRQCEILELLAKGRDVPYIMEKFYISKSTAKTHVYNIYRKMDVHSKQELFNMVEDLQLPEDENVE